MPNSLQIPDEPVNKAGIELRQYLEIAFLLLEEDDSIFREPDDTEPDLLTLAEYLIAIKGEVKKMNMVSLSLNNNIKDIIESAGRDLKNKRDSATISHQIIQDIIVQDEIQNRLLQHFNELPVLENCNVEEFACRFNEWKQGYLIFSDRWNKFMNAAGLQMTGISGEHFNPEFHEAIDTISDVEKPENVILEMIEPGYLYRDKPVKTAKVIVNKHNKCK